MIKNTLFLFFLLQNCIFYAQKNDEKSLSLLFLGDIMGHQPQLNSAYDHQTKSYDFSPVFEKVKHKFEKADFTIGNLEVTLAGKPYSGYPQFSSPDELAVACKNSGIDVLVTANNHTCDSGKKGIIRTLNVLDSLGIKHTGTFRNKEEFEKNNLLILSKNGISVGILNYTYGTNGLPIPEPTVVNLIDTLQMKSDIEKAKKQLIDKLIVVIHWGIEYDQKPNKNQEKVAQFLFENGVDVIIGGHPHVLQPMYFYPETRLQNERFIVYSLGNFVSNQRKTPTDGGAMVEVSFCKTPIQTRISSVKHYLTWVHKWLNKNTKKYHFEIILCSQYENNTDYLDEKAQKAMHDFIENSRKILPKGLSNFSLLSLE